jgi:RNA polymerase sigma-70 factor (ECF subfamily)
MDEHEWLAERFQKHRPRLRAVAFRMLGSGTEADDAVQEAWLRLSDADADEIDNLEAWLVTVVGRVALNMLRSRRTRREDSLEERLPDPVDDQDTEADPEHQAMLADSVGLALLVILETLTPAERLAYVLHDMFSVPYEEIGTILDRTPEAARQLASRGRRRIREGSAAPEPDVTTQRRVVDAFLAAARQGDFDGLLAVLDPEAVVREDTGSGLVLAVSGAENVARRSKAFNQLDLVAHPARVNGGIGFVAYLEGDLFTVAALTVRNDRIAALDFTLAPERLAALDYAILD